MAAGVRGVGAPLLRGEEPAVGACRLAPQARASAGPGLVVKRSQLAFHTCNRSAHAASQLPDIKGAHLQASLPGGQRPLLPCPDLPSLRSSCAELPQERIDELFMLQMPARQQPPAAQQQRQQQQQNGGQQQQQQQQDGGQARQAAEQFTAAGPSAQLQWPSREPGGSHAGVAGPSAARPGSSAAQGVDGRATKRARRAEERAYNEAVIGEQNRGVFVDGL